VKDKALFELVKVNFKVIYVTIVVGVVVAKKCSHIVIVVFIATVIAISVVKVIVIFITDAITIVEILSHSN